MKYKILLALITLFCITGCTEINTPTPSSSFIETQRPVQIQETKIKEKTLEEIFQDIKIETAEEEKETVKSNNLSNDNYYTNSRGNKVHSPAYAPSRPAGASAKCRDGTYSFSQNRRGTCSHHGGVATWY